MKKVNSSSSVHHEYSVGVLRLPMCFIVNPHNTLWDGHQLLSSFHRCGNWGTQMRTAFLKTQKCNLQYLGAKIPVAKDELKEHNVSLWSWHIWNADQCHQRNSGLCSARTLRSRWWRDDGASPHMRVQNASPLWLQPLFSFQPRPAPPAPGQAIAWLRLPEDALQAPKKHLVS